MSETEESRVEKSGPEEVPLPHIDAWDLVDRLSRGFQHSEGKDAAGIGGDDASIVYRPRDRPKT